MRTTGPAILEQLPGCVAGLVAAALTLGPIAAQTVWTVDSLGGAQFTTISAAVQAASDGDIVEVQAPGFYSMGITLTKGVTIVGVGTSAARVSGTLQIRNLPAGRTVLLRSLTTVTEFTLDCDGLAGTVACENVRLFSRARPALLAHNCALVSVHGGSCEGTPGMWVYGSSVAASGAAIVGAIPFTATSLVGFPGIDGNGSARLGITSCSVTGADIGGFTLMAPGLTLGAGCVLRSSGTVFLGGADSFHGQIVRAISAILDPLAQLEVDDASALPLAPSGPWTVVPQCRLTGHGGAPGSTASVTAMGPASGIVGLFVSAPAAATTSPFGDLWLDPAATELLQIGSLPTLTWSAPIPPGFPRGLAFTFQAGCIVPGATTLSPPLTTMVL